MKVDNKIVDFKSEINTDWGHTTVFLNNFPFDYFFIAESVLRRYAKFEIRWLCLSKFYAIFETQENSTDIERKFT